MPRPAPVNTKLKASGPLQDEPTTPTIRVSRPSSSMAPHSLTPYLPNGNSQVDQLRPVPPFSLTPSSPTQENVSLPESIHPNQVSMADRGTKQVRKQITVLSNGSVDEGDVNTSSTENLVTSDMSTRVEVLQKGVDNPVFSFGEEELRRMRIRPRNSSEGNLRTTTKGGVLLPPLNVESSHFSPLTPFLNPKEMDSLTVPDSLSLAGRFSFLSTIQLTLHKKPW